ncbi:MULTISPECIES: DUF2690 domain-containing protein [unclassified Streptomyces]|uniref:helix-turn-helix domain-containing protein n=1 Tax=unclassified Streptomyces TaxID=2593676 RepID=UPI0035D8DAD8
MPGWKALPDELDPEVRAFTERIRRLIDRSGLGVAAVAERTGRERASWDAYLTARRPLPRGAVTALAEATGADPSDLTIRWERTRGRYAAGDGGSGGGAPEVPSPAPRSTASEGEHRIPAPEDEHRTPAPVPPPPPGHGTRTRRTTVLLHAVGILGALLVVTAALLLVDLGGGDGPDGAADGRAAAPSTTSAPGPPPRTALPAGVKCSGADCAGRDPEAMGCGGPLAVTVARARVGTAGVEVRHSAACSASWARITGAAPGDTVSVEVAGATERATVPEDADTAATGTDAYTPMLAVAPGAAARACGTLADGTGACTAGP